MPEASMTQLSPAGTARASSSLVSLPIPSAVQDPDNASTCGIVRLMAAGMMVRFKAGHPDNRVATPNG
ncbi:hypothetical protein D3C79_954670 [compost metagenome]